MGEEWANPGIGRVPADVLAFLDVPVDGRRRARRNAARLGTAKLGPIARGGAGGPKDREKKLCFDCVAHAVKET